MKLVTWLYNASFSFFFYLMFVININFKAVRYIRYTVSVYSMFVRSALVPYGINWPSINYIGWLQTMFMLLRKMYIGTQAIMILYLETFKCCASRNEALIVIQLLIKAWLNTIEKVREYNINSIQLHFRHSS